MNDSVFNSYLNAFVLIRWLSNYHALVLMFYIVTGEFAVEHHHKEGNIPGTDEPFSCDFDNYMEFDEYAVATVEVPGAQFYLSDERGDYPTQDEVDPLEGRYKFWLNAVLCFEDWIEYTIEKAHSSGKKAIFFAHQAHYWGVDVEVRSFQSQILVFVFISHYLCQMMLVLRA